MVLDSILSSPHRRSPSFRKQFSRDDSLSWPTLLQRHRFLLIALILLAFLCTMYLYFAVTLGASGSCSDLKGAQKASCLDAKASVGNGKLKFLWHVDDNYSWKAFPSLVLFDSKEIEFNHTFKISIGCLLFLNSIVLNLIYEKCNKIFIWRLYSKILIWRL